jgi:hypothetical protein
MATPPATLSARLSVIRDPRARAATVIRFLRRASPQHATLAIHEAIVRARRAGAAEALVALDAIALALTADTGLSYDTTSALYGAAVAQDLSVVARLFFAASAESTSAEPPRAQPEVERPARPGGPPMPHGTRKWLARLSRTDALPALASDPHPEVIASFLQNPAITERDVLAIASRRPTHAACQLAVFLSDRWRFRQPVRRALALNPYTPVPLATRLALTLRNRDLREIAADSGLSPSLRQHADELARLATG